LLFDEDEHHTPRVDEPCRGLGPRPRCRRQSAPRSPRVGPGVRSSQTSPRATTHGR
jgi:hypothetical protein